MQTYTLALFIITNNRKQSKCPSLMTNILLSNKNKQALDSLPDSSLCFSVFLYVLVTLCMSLCLCLTLSLSLTSLHYEGHQKENKTTSLFFFLSDKIISKSINLSV